MNMKRIGQLIAAFSMALILAGCASTDKDESTGEFIDDTVLTAKVKTALLKDPMVSGLSVNVETFKGLVQLSGFVKTKAESERAHNVANEVPGVTTIINNIVLR